MSLETLLEAAKFLEHGSDGKKDEQSRQRLVPSVEASNRSSEPGAGTKVSEPLQNLTSIQLATSNYGLKHSAGMITLPMANCCCWVF